MATTTQTGFGELLRRYRMEAGLTQEELAERAGISTRGVSDLERGARGLPRKDTLQLLLQALDLSPADRSTLVAAARRPPPPAGRRDPAEGQLHIPVPLTPLIGREAEITAVFDLLRDPAVRLVTLTGPGGTGKTRLAIAVAEPVASRFPDGVVFVPLAPLGDPAFVASAIAQRLGVREAAGQTLIDRLELHLADTQQLLILDNFEHLLPAAPLIADLLMACPSLKILVTSRAVLHLSAEQTFPVSPLALPDPVHLPPLDALGQTEAVRLFVGRAHAAKPDFVLSEANAPAVAEIVRRVDGLPLALELAAARVRILSPAALLARLDRRLPLLTGGALDLPDRQRTLRDTIAWSYDLLPPQEQALFRRLAVCAGGWTLEAAEAVGDASHDLGVEVLEGMTALVEHSLVHQQGRDDVPRFGMLETVREFGLEQLEQSDEADLVRRAHAVHFLECAERLDAGLLGPEQGDRLEELEREHDNYRTALNWAFASGDPVGPRLAMALSWFWRLHGHLREGRFWLERTVSEPAGLTLAMRMHASSLLRGFLEEFGRTAEARELYEGSLATSREIGDRRGMADSLYDLGLLAFGQGEYALAQPVLAECLAVSREAGEREAIALTIMMLGATSLAQGDVAVARPLLEESLELFQAEGYRQRVARTLYYLALLTQADGTPDRAWELLEESLALFRHVRHQIGIADALSALGWLALAQGEPAVAAARFTEGLATCEAMGSLRGVASTLEGSAALGAAKYPARSLRLAGAVSVLREKSGHAALPSEAIQFKGRLDAARRILDRGEAKTAWAIGRTMPLEEAVSEAFALLSEPWDQAETVRRGMTASFGLTNRELQVLRLIAEGHSNDEIAGMLSVSRRTVTTHATGIFTKLGVGSRTAASATAHRLGLL